MRWVILLLLVFLIGCAAEVEELPKVTEEEVQLEEGEEAELLAWQEFKLIDINGKTFNIAESKKPILLETFAVWCPTCKKQQDNGKEAHKSVDFTSITVDIDPNEDEQLVRDYVKRYNYGGSYIIAPKEFTQMLIDEFGFGIASAPAAPIVLICENTYRFLDRGIKSAEELVEAVKSC